MEWIIKPKATQCRAVLTRRATTKSAAAVLLIGTRYACRAVCAGGAGQPLPRGPSARYVRSTRTSLGRAARTSCTLPWRPTRCQDACGGMTLRRLTAADRAASSLARA
eukprot:scaffold49769_cov54-Phaeocystis_antarctica.AAC.8